MILDRKFRESVSYKGKRTVGIAFIENMTISCDPAARYVICEYVDLQDFTEEKGYTV